MLRIRRTEEVIEELLRSGEISGSFHSSVGQEACAAGVGGALEPTDVVTSTHRGHGHALAKGVPLTALISELFGRRSGASGGKGGSMHLHHRSSGFLGESAIVAGAMAWAAGAAWARRKQGYSSIGVAFVGDGAIGQGIFHETLRMAMVWQSPCLFVCENNGFAHSMRVEQTVGKPGAIAEVVSATGMLSEYVDGRDVVKVREVARHLVDHVRVGSPAFLECEVYRVRPHSLSDADYRYRDKGVGDAWLRENDPIAALRVRLEKRFPSDLEKIEAEVESEIVRAIDEARQAAVPDPSDAFSDLYVTPELNDEF